MDFKDWRKSSLEPLDANPAREDQPAPFVKPEQSKQPTQEQQTPGKHFSGKRFADHIDEQIREAEARGVFRNLPGLGQPLNLDTNPYAGEKALGYSLLKSNGYLPAEIELMREIDRDLERQAARRAGLSKRRRDLRRRRVPPFASEKRAYNVSVTRALAEYEATLRELNRKILTLNLSTPPSMHRIPLDVERMVSEFRAECPLFA